MTEVLEALRPRLSPVPRGRALLGLSGGADSVALLFLLLPLRAEGRLELEAIHVHHGLRGPEADGDETFARELCAAQGIPYHAAYLRLGDRRDEDAAREARYGAFCRCLRETGIDQLILAHHRDDQAETFLMRLMRGAGTDGLACMRPVEERDGYRILRPMLGISGGDLRAALAGAGIPWREDRSNADEKYLRNRVRHTLLPLMEEACPGTAERIARAAALIGEDQRLLEEEAKARLAGHAGEAWLETGALRSADAGMRRRMLRLWWRSAGPELEERQLSFRQTEALSALADEAPGRVVNLPGGWRAKRGRNHLHLLPPERPAPPAPVPAEQGAVLNGIRLEVLPGEGNPGDGLRTQEVPAGFLRGCEIRTRRPGDRIRPYGMQGSKSLQDYLTDRGVDEPWRDRIPLLCRGGEVLLAAGVGAGNVPDWRGDAPKERLSWTGPMPWMPEERNRDEQGQRSV